VLRLYFIALAGSFLTSLAVTPLSILLARRFGAVDAPDPRKVHHEPKPRWGGIGVMAGFFVAIFLLWFLMPEFRKLLSFNHGIVKAGKVVFTLNLGEQLAGILFGALLLFGVGLVDDRRPVPAGMKLTLQIIAAYVAMTYGVRIYGLSLRGYESQFPLWLMQLVTVLWLTGLCNAVNLIDGLDGLAGGVIAIAAGAFLAVTLVQERAAAFVFTQQMKLAGVIAAALMGGTLGFLIYNFHPAHVFMGDSGSLSIGFLTACVAVIGAFKTTTLAVLLVPFVLVAIPVADMTLAFGRRLLKRQNPFSPDRGHLHHRLLDAGWTQREVVFMVYVVTLVLASIAITAVAAKRGA
jgi:UDP-GlcNAc:undecaprenyl-phosphate/decaprenyl-phosphate GlcNAc-1-phosphate transferase